MRPILLVYHQQEEEHLLPSKLPRINVTVTEEQHALLLELASLQGGSAAGFLRQQLDVSTPLLRAAVPLLRQAARETEVTKAKAANLLAPAFQLLQEHGVFDQIDMFDKNRAGGGERTQRSERSERGREELQPAPFPDDEDDEEIGPANG